LAGDEKTKEDVMNQEQFGQFWAQLEVPLKNQWGKFTDDDLRIETRYGENKNEVSAWASRRYAHWTGWYQGYEDLKTGV